MINPMLENCPKVKHTVLYIPLALSLEMACPFFEKSMSYPRYIVDKQYNLFRVAKQTGQSKILNI